MITTDWTGAPGIRMNRQQICQTFGLTDYALKDYLHRGADVAVVRRGSKSLDWQIDSAVFLDWFIRFKCDPQFTKSIGVVRRYIDAVGVSDEDAA